MLFNVTGSGGNPINFRVVGGTTQPTSPKENTIWVKTAIDIPAVYLNKGPSPTWANSKGTVAISYEPIRGTGNITPTTPTLNLIKSGAGGIGGIFAMLNACYQNQDGTAAGWKPMEAFTYKSGQWVDWWDGHKLYSFGNQFKDVTGGWEIKNNTDMSTAAVTFGDDGIAMNASSHKNAWVTTKNLIDLSGVVSLEVDVEEYESSGGEAYANIRVYKEGFGWAQTGSSYAAASASITKTGTTALDVTALTGSYYVTIRVIASTGYTQKIKFSEVRQV